MAKKQTKKNEVFYRVGYQISQRGIVKEIRLVGDGYNEIYDIDEALSLAEKEELDLVEINPSSNPPICKIIDYSKFLYEKKKRKKEQEKIQRKKKQEIKELRFGPNTDNHDFEFKKKHAIKFLNNGDKVKAFVFFKGREIAFKEQGEILLLRFADDLSELCKVESLPKLEGNRMILMLSPKKSK
jgi:translation initiation factor IF-3